ncbi:MAG: hypothetical protein HF974_05935 [ANME-2 cluster archaeon]|nr:hypothetical protein [ANME-2 cluster archaeon]
MAFSDYYEELEEEEDKIKPSCTREENLEKIIKAVRVWRNKHGVTADLKMATILEAQKVFSDTKKYNEFCKWYQEQQRTIIGTSPEEEFGKLVHGASMDGIITPAEYQMLLEDAERKEIPKREAEEIIQRIAEEYDATIGETEAQPLGVPKLEVDCDYLDFKNIKLGKSQSQSFTISNVGGGALRGTIKASQLWIRVPDHIDPSMHKQQTVVTIDTDGLVSGFAGTGVIDVKTNGGNSQITVKLGTEGYKDALNQFSTRLGISSVFAGAAIGSLFGTFGSGGAMFIFLLLLGAIGYEIYWKFHERFRGPISTSVGLSLLYIILVLGVIGSLGWSFLFALIYFFVSPLLMKNDDGDDNIIGGVYWLIGLLLLGLVALSNHSPVAGGIVCGIIASILVTWLFSERLFDYQCSNQDIPSASSVIIDFKKDIVHSTSFIAGIFMILAICAAISSILSVFIIIIMVIIIIKYHNSIKDKYRI